MTINGFFRLFYLHSEGDAHLNRW